MVVVLDVGLHTFSEWDGSLNDREHHIVLPHLCTLATSIPMLIWLTFGNDLTKVVFDGRSCIIAPTSRICDILNDIIVGMLPGTTRSYTVINTSTSKQLIPTEFLDTKSLVGLPNALITLKIGVIIMCIRNISESLKNGTRLRVTELYQTSLKAVIITEGGYHGREEMILPKIFNNDEAKVEFSRVQLPIRISYAMTINKSHCQTLKRIGLVLDDEMTCFSHGQRYVALSRVSTGPSGIVCSQHKLLNVVFKDAFKS